jgi:hypothetical protein
MDVVLSQLSPHPSSSAFLNSSVYGRTVARDDEAYQASRTGSWRFTGPRTATDSGGRELDGKLMPGVTSVKCMMKRPLSMST